MRSQRLASSVSVAGYAACGFHRRALELARQALRDGRVGHLDESLTFGSREAFHAWLCAAETRRRFAANERALGHRSSPFVFADGGTFVGGCDDLQVWLEAGQSSGHRRLAPPAEFPGRYGLAQSYDGSRDLGDEAFSARLTPTQFAVLRRGATEERGVVEAKGGFDDVYESQTTYECAACALPLYSSAMKFDCGCGWPGFFACIDGSVFAKPDKDGVRTEIVCNGCGSHLGHVYANEGFHGMACSKSGNVVNSDHRHCVNSVAVVLRRPKGELHPCTFKGRVFLRSFRTPENPTAPTTLMEPWSENSVE